LTGNTWLENKSFAIEPPVVPSQQQSTIPKKSNPIIDIKPKEEKKPVHNIVTKKTETNEFVFDLRFSVITSNLKIDVNQILTFFT
jgi:hypothetical protein